MRVWLTGAFTIEGDDGPIPRERLPGRQGRLLLAYLITEHGHAVRRGDLAELLWGAHPPATSDKAIAVVISKLRAVLVACGVDGSRALTNAFGCYQLTLPEGTWIDVESAAELAGSAEDALRRGAVDAALSSAREAIELGRRPFLPGADGPWVADRRAALAAVLAGALDCAAEAALRTNDAAGAVGAAREAVALEPFREASHRNLMRAHASAGNRADALRAYERYRALLANELGVDPDPQTEAVYLDILRSTPTVLADAPSEPSPPPAAPTRARPIRRRRTWAAAAAGATTAVLVGAVLIATHGQSTEPPRFVPPNSVVAIDPAANRIGEDVGVGARPGDVVFAAGALWVANLDDGTLSEVNVDTHALERTVVVHGRISHLTADQGSVWLTTTAGVVSRVDTTFGTLSPVAHVVDTHWLPDPPHPLSVRDGSVWVVDPGGEVDRIDVSNGHVLSRDLVGQDAAAIAVDDEGAWVANASDGTVSRIDRTDAVIATIPVGHGPAGVVLGSNAVWVTDSFDDRVVRIDPRTNAVEASIPVGRGPGPVISAGGSVWVGNVQSGSVSRIDPATNRVTATVQLGASPGGFAYADGKVWVTAVPLAVTHAGGGVLRVDIAADPSSLDPALAVDPIAWQLLYATCVKLFNYPDLPAPSGYVLRPEAAEAVPSPAPDGRTYRFVVRPGYRFAPPASQPVTAQTFADAIERVLSPAMRSPGARYAADIEGASAFRAGRADHVSGIRVSGDRLTIRLAAPAPDFLARLSMPFFCAVPIGTPVSPRVTAPLPGAGPYTIASYTPDQQIVLRVNPNYHGDRTHRFAEIVYSIGVGPDASLANLKSGKADYAPDSLPVAAYRGLAAKYGPTSPAAHAGRQRYFVNTSAGIRYLVLNTARPLFADVRLRQAVNYAIDRPALVEQQRRFFAAYDFGGGIPISGYLPPGFLGYPPRSPYPVDGPDLATARRLAAGRRGVARLYTCDQSPCPEQAQIIKKDLAAIGIRVVIFEFPKPIMFAKIEDPSTPYDIVTVGFGTDYPDPSQFLNANLDGANITPTGNVNFALFDDRHFNAAMRAAARLSGAARFLNYGRLADEIARRAAPLVAYSTDAVRDFFSARIGCQSYQPVYGMALATLCLRR
ncbi:MAG: family transcriptional regulator, regulator of embCAB operon [Pseudonocardiales bacterium]|nr:family transcriptional regulator, regulator of embCAB operon [Pseudonocardiales bacterium]